MLGFLKNLLRRAPEAPAESPQPSFPAAPGPVPHPGSAAPLSRGYPGLQSHSGIELPLDKVLRGLPLELQPRVRQPEVGNRTIAIPLEKILAQLSHGVVKVSFGELRQALPDIFTQETDRDRVLVPLPLEDILARLNPSLITRRRVQRIVEVPDEISSPFDPNGMLAEADTPPLAPYATPEPLEAPVPPPAPMPAPPARPSLTSVPTPPPPATAPLSRVAIPPAPLSRPLPPAPPLPSAPLPPAQSAEPAPPLPPVAPIPFSPMRPSAPRLVQSPPVPSLFTPEQPPSPPAAPPPPPVSTPLPPAPAPASPAFAAPVSPFNSPQTGPTAPPLRSPYGNGNGNGHSNGNGNGNGHGNGHSTQVPGSNGFSAPLQPVAPSLVPQPAASAEFAEPLVVGLATLAEAWPEAVRREILELKLVEAQVALPAKAIEDGLRQGRIIITWKVIRSYIRPAVLPSVSIHDSLALELPLKVVAPLFLARQRTAAKAQSKVVIDEEIPNLFFGFPQSEPAPLAPSNNARPQDTNYYVWDDAADMVKVHESELKRGPTPGTKFVAKYATPNEIVSRAAGLEGVAGALISLPDGLMVASKISADLNGETLAAFLPQIFGKVSQCTKELRMGELNNLNFTVGNVPWKIFRVNAIFFAAFGCAGQPLPTSQLAALAAELDHKPK